MYNLLISIGIAAVAFTLGSVVTGTFIAGFIPGILALGIAYVLLARRTTRQLQEAMEKVGASLKKIRPEDSPITRKQRLDEAVQLLEDARKYGRWQFLVNASVDSQLGALCYIQQDWAKARPYLEKAWMRDWTAHTMLAVMDYRDKKLDEAAKRLEKVSGPAKKEAIFWGIWAWILAEGGEPDKALSVVARGLKEMPESEALKALQDSLSNKKKIRTNLFAPMWYTFFPEQVPMQRVAAPPTRGKGYPMPRR